MKKQYKLMSEPVDASGEDTADVIIPDDDAVEEAANFWWAAAELRRTDAQRAEDIRTKAASLRWNALIKQAQTLFVAKYAFESDANVQGSLMTLDGGVGTLTQLIAISKHTPYVLLATYSITADDRLTETCYRDVQAHAILKVK